MTELADIPVVAEHELLRLIGRGSGGEVWLARNPFGTYRAVKIIRESEFTRRSSFEREMNGILKFEPISRLHDGLVDILQVGKNDTEGYFYYVMELSDDIVCGQNVRAETYLPRTLEADKRRLGKLPIAECVRLGAAIASALGFLHKNNLVHRDIKPSNIIFVNGIPKLADIGLLTDASEGKSFVGTEGFIPDEGSGSVRADIYALGKVLYEISTGNDRIEYPELPEIDNSAESRDLILLNKIVLKACRAKAWDRYQTAEEMMMALLAFEFDKDALRRRERVGLLTRAAIVGGTIVTVAIIVGFVWRLVWLLNHKG